MSSETTRDLNCDTLCAQIRKLGATLCQFIPSARLLVPEEKIRRFCTENKCGCYGNHLMCPPFVGTIPEAAEKISTFTDAILIQYSKGLNVETDTVGLNATKRTLHDIILETERYLQKEMGISTLMGLIGGSCERCNPCAGFMGKPCPYPSRARTSMEALGIDVIALLERLDLDGKFHADKITWTGMILIA
ncbi:MAG: DUF2284 domain-containing protein [Desulfobacterales bacterium]|jgi:predicted metal-binding protein|nr:DUF2284 domain-containing protein [Desulfobacterales bacterium]